MIRNYLKTTWRNLTRNKLFTALNIFGLATGMACSLLIFLWVQDEKSFDRFNRDADKIYRITAKVSDVNAAVVPPALAAAVKEIPAIKNATRISAFQRTITVDTKKFEEKRIYFADTNFLKIFDYPLLQGNVENVLSAPNAVVLTEATAIKYFGNANAAMGKPVYIDNDILGTNLVVTGVLKNIPHNSHLQFDLLLPMQIYDAINPPHGMWNNFDDFVYFKVQDNFAATQKSLRQIEQQINHIRSSNDKQNLQATLSIQPLTDIHLHSNFMLDVEGQGSSKQVTIFSLVAVFILVIACINFMNLATAVSSQRSKEVGLRKTVGARRFQLIIQFISESLLLSFISLIIAIALGVLLLPLFNELASKTISISQLNGNIVAMLLLAGILVGVLSGCYPAFVLSSFNPVHVLKGAKVLQGRKSFLRNGLVVFQFAISVVLMVSTLVVYRQLQFIKNRDIGFNKENLLYIKMPEGGDLHDKKEALKATLNNYPGITDYTITDHLPTYLTVGGRISWPTMDPDQQVIGYRLRTDENFLKTFDMHLIAGRFFSKDFKSDDSAYVVNETTLRAMKTKPEDAVGKKVMVDDQEGTIIGVVKDFNFKPIQQPVEPLALKSNFAGGYIVLRTTPVNIQNILLAVKNVFGKVYGDYPFSYGFIDEDLSKLYRTEQRMGKLFNLFSILSIIISCLGLFGLATFATQKRIKEIGVRKVLGASETGIVAMLSKDFIKLVIVALLIAFPLSGWLMNKWLESFAYRINISWWMFVLTGAVALMIALITVSYQSIKAAIANPVKSLKTE